jgi:hypothetical protein
MPFARSLKDFSFRVYGHDGIWTFNSDLADAASAA